MSAPLLRNIKVFALAGGAGSRLMPLTAKRAKPAVPFGAKWTIFDLVMWSLYHSGFRDVGVLVQKNAVSLTDHLAQAWPRRPDGGSYFQVLPPEGFEGRHEYLGTADAVYQHLHYAGNSDAVMVVSGDHLYKVDFSTFWNFHVSHEADLSIMATMVPVSAARAFGVMGTDADNKVNSFKEKPEQPQEVFGAPGQAYCSMGVYLFKYDVLERYLREDARHYLSSHDFGKDIIPKMIRDKMRVFAYSFSDSSVPGQAVPYWRDVGTLDVYWQEHMNLCSDNPTINLFSEEWPITTVHDRTPPAKFANNVVCDHVHLAGGCIIDNSRITYSVLGRKVTIRSGCSIQESIVFNQVVIENDCVLKKVIVDVDPYLQDDERVVIPAGTQIGVDHALDEERGFTITDSGITVVPYDWFRGNKTIRVE